MREEYLAVYLIACFFAFIVGATISYASGPYGASIIIDLAIIMYAILLSTLTEARWIPLALALGAHVSALLTYYSHPLILPFLVIERSSHGYSLNVDLVQAIIAYEIIFERDGKMGEKTLKRPTPNAQEYGTPEEPP